MTTGAFANKIVVVFILQSIAVRKVLETVARFITHVTQNLNKFGESRNILSGNLETSLRVFAPFIHPERNLHPRHIARCEVACVASVSVEQRAKNGVFGGFCPREK